MSDRIVVSIDLGTTGCRAAAYSEGGRCLASHHVEYGLTHPEPGAAEQEAEGWWSAARSCVKAVGAELADASSVVAIGISAQGHSWVPTNEDFRPLRPALTWLDTRAAAIARGLLEARGAHFWGRQAGKAPGAWHTLPQLLWLREQEPAVEKQATNYLYAHDFLVAKLTGQPVTDFTTAAASLLFSVQDFVWDEALAAEWLVDVGRFPEAKPAGSVAGVLSWDTAKDLSLPAGIPVAVGAQDQKCAALAVGLEHGVATASLGTATAITALTERPSFDERAGIPCFPYLTEGAWVLEAPLTTTGAALRWLRDFLRASGAEELQYDDLVRIAADAPPGSGGVRFFPFLAGAGAPHWIADAGGGFVGIGLDTIPAHLARAVLEGVAFEIRSNLDAMREQAVEIDCLRLFGGGARSDLWASIIAGVCGLSVERSSDVEAAAAGAAILALRAAGVCDNLGAGQKLLRGTYDWFEPKLEATYQDVYTEYVAMRGSYWRLNSARRSS